MLLRFKPSTTSFSHNHLQASAVGPKALDTTYFVTFGRIFIMKCSSGLGTCPNSECLVATSGRRFQAAGRLCKTDPPNSADLSR
eukprot:m.134468 g.134468  ORF g.134468 m.134468 type:complete len:84 (+) comp13868_c0_seq4:1935-2186(+)